ncbi:CO dehydrogenase/acetyl-CoA synthase complex, epsilon subunit [Methanococcus aeolicus Nankai-3]|uniref:CO dehydrogenase/acetyl-CoA synthase complex, epsilon subunit n=1 Tax=Methanococcus aeolicus (strain ATCC BAA-1280 / DSM 17508 / OCM 812 / Nankai-3) TaxID=419665 RepID=A6UU88_META3|nr:CO dehydrogenase/acetyl-CoA synthase complex subunit epsilon [Methanococcus aeolicus]ABR56060.1 CO dehydrogenase/acetyl-CoA synthase complex, epsilon subunit [Methanococcus aeolicus Nankai-3]
MSAWNPALSSPNQAIICSPKIAALTIKQSKNPMFVMGSLLNVIPEEIAEYAIKIAKLKHMTVVSTGGSNIMLSKLNFKPHYNIGAVELINHLKDSNWNGFCGKGNYDLICFIGVPYYIGSQGLSTLKNFAPHLKTITLCKFMHPNADLSYPNMSYDGWVIYLSKLVEYME